MLNNYSRPELYILSGSPKVNASPIAPKPTVNAVLILEKIPTNPATEVPNKADTPTALE